MHQKFAPVTPTVLLLTSCSSTSRDFQCEMFQVYRASGKKNYWRFKKKKKRERNRRKKRKKGTALLSYLWYCQVICRVSPGWPVLGERPF